MGDLIRGETFAANEMVTAPRLHRLVEEAIIKDGAITGSKIAPGSITETHLAGGGFGTTPGALELTLNHIILGNANNKGTTLLVGSSLQKTGTFDVAAGGILTSMLGDGVLSADDTGRAKMADKFVTFAKIQDINAGRLLGRPEGSAGPIQEIELGSGLMWEDGKLASVGGPWGLVITAHDDLPAGGTGYSREHGLGARPVLIFADAYPLTAELGYQPESGGQPPDHVPLWAFTSDNGNPAYVVWANSTHWGIECPTHPSWLANRSTHGWATIERTNWRLRITLAS